MRQGNDKCSFREQQHSRSKEEAQIPNFRDHNRINRSISSICALLRSSIDRFWSMDQEGGSICSMWAPGSPRLSFSRDFVQSDVFNPSALHRQQQQQQLQDPSDFDFGMLALLRTDDHHGAAVADEIFQNGKLLPIDSARNNRLHDSQEEAAAPAIVGSEQTMRAHESSSSSRIQQQVPKSPSSRWKELFGLNKRSSSSSLRSSSFSSSSASISETEPLNASISSCESGSAGSCSKPSKLKLLFRSSSAGAGRQQHQEPSLGRSASESKVSSCCNHLHLQVVEAGNADLLIRSRATTGSPSIQSETGEEKAPKIKQLQHDLVKKNNTQKSQRRKVPKSGAASQDSQQQQQQQQRRKALAEMKGGCCSSRTTINKQNCLNPSQQNQNHHSHHQEKPQKPHPHHHKNSSSSSSSSSIDAWRVYSERMSNASSGGSSGKVAEVLHMEVCMGQSMVVSRVAKAFIKKENQNHHGSSSSSSSSSGLKIVGVAGISR